jgi:hypothetical protein
MKKERRSVFDRISDRDLVIRMLQHEDQLFHSPAGQEIVSHAVFTSIEGSNTLKRKTLNHFGFSTCDESLDNYNKIISYYYRSPHDFDADVMNSATYFRMNRCLYYDSPILRVGDTIPDVLLDDKNRLFDVLDHSRPILIQAFSST